MNTELTDLGDLVSDFSPSITLLEEAMKVCKNNREVALKEDRPLDVQTYNYQIQSHEVAIEILHSMMDEE